MFSPPEIIKKLYGIIGFKKPFNPAYDLINDDNLISRSGYFITDNPFCKVEYIYDSQDYKDISETDFNLFLKQKQEESIISVCNAVFNKADYIDRNLIYKNASNKINTEVLPAGFVGYKILVSDKKNIGITIKRVLCEFQGIGSFKILLFNTAKSTPLYTKTIAIANTQNETTLDWDLNNTLSVYKGDFYIGYLTSSLTITPFKRDYNLANLISTISEVCLQPILVKNHFTETLFDLNLVEGNSGANGLNFDISVYEDFTDFIIQNEKLFARAIQLDCQISFLTEYLASLRSNRNERNSAQLVTRIMQEIEGETGENNAKVTGLRPQLFRSLNSIKSEVKKLQEGFFGQEIFVDTLN